MVIAGGSVLAALLRSGTHGRRDYWNQFNKTDFDVFIYGLNAKEATEKIFSVCNQIKSNVGSGHVLISQHSITLIGIHPIRHIQFVLRLYR